MIYTRAFCVISSTRLMAATIIYYDHYYYYYIQSALRTRFDVGPNAKPHPSPIVAITFYRYTLSCDPVLNINYIINCEQYII